MGRVGIIVGLFITLVGAVWVLQGLNVAFAPESFMTNNRQWVVYGGVTAVAGLAIAGWSWRRG